MQCTAKSKRTGKQCGVNAMANGKCYHHGGKTTIIGNTSAAKPGGIYSKFLTPDEQTDHDAIELGRVEDELRLCRIYLQRCVKSDTNEPELDTIDNIGGDENSPGKHNTHYKRMDYTARAVMLMGRIQSLELARKALLDTLTANSVITLIDAPSAL